MKILIPYRENSSRLPHKNIKEFHDGKSLLDLTIEQFDGHEIILASVFSDVTAEIAKKHNASHLFLNEEEHKSFSHVIVDMAEKVTTWAELDEPILVWFATELTFFINHSAKELIDFGLESFEQGFDSTVLCRPFKHFLLDHNFKPENFSYGPWFSYSQTLDQKYWVIPGIGMTTPRSMLQYRWSNGPEYRAFVAHPLYVDIDEEFEFKLAQTMWKTFK